MLAAQAQGELHQEVLVLQLAPEGEVFAWRPVAKGVLPVQRAHDRFDLVRAQPTGIQAANHRAHARTGDHVDRNVQLLKNLEHAYVRCTSGTTAGQYQPDARTMG